MIVCMFLVSVTFPLWYLFQCELVWCATARKGAGVYNDLRCRLSNREISFMCVHSAADVAAAALLCVVLTSAVSLFVTWIPFAV